MHSFGPMDHTAAALPSRTQLSSFRSPSLFSIAPPLSCMWWPHHARLSRIWSLRGTTHCDVTSGAAWGGHSTAHPRRVARHNAAVQLHVAEVVVDHASSILHVAATDHTQFSRMCGAREAPHSVMCGAGCAWEGTARRTAELFGRTQLYSSTSPK